MLCVNSNLSVNGKLKANVIESDDIHLWTEGVAILASNIKQEIDQICNVIGPQGGSRQIIHQNRLRTFNRGYRNNYQQKY